MLILDLWGIIIHAVVVFGLGKNLLLIYCRTLCNDSIFSKELVISKNSCRFAQLKCSYRTGCGSTLQSFIIECDGLIHNKTNVCSETCKNTLVGLTSTLEGQKLMTVSYIYV